MALISKTSDDGSNGGDQGGEVENLAPIALHIPEELIESIILLVGRCHYPNLSLVSKAFRRIISSPELYQRRLHLGLTEPVIYALIRFPGCSFPNWYILNRNVSRKISLRLSQVSSLPPIKPGSAVVTIGYNMYVIGGCIGLNQHVSTVFVIDCRFHTWDYLPNMQRARCFAAAGVIDGKIYVIGGCKKPYESYDDWIEVFDVENEIWSPVPDTYDHDPSFIGGVFVTYVVMQEKICIWSPECCLSYEPRQGTWGIENGLWLLWHESCCVVDDLLYSIDHWCVLGHPLVVYDPNKMGWKPVKGVSGLPKLNYSRSKLANLGGKLVILGRTYSSLYGYKDVWCLEIALEKREGGEIWGKVASRSHVLRSMNMPDIDLCRSVTF